MDSEKLYANWFSELCDEYYVCTNCLHGDTYFGKLPKVCPKCGAIMISVVEGEEE